MDPQDVVELAMRCMPRGQFAAVVAGTDGLLRTFAASSPVHATIDRIRETVGHDPAADAIEANDVVVSDFLADDPRWPAFGPRASLALIHEVVIGQPVPPARSRAVHTEIGVAVGILMAGTGLGTSGAYRRLHDASRHLRRSLPETARYVVEHRRLPLGPASL